MSELLGRRALVTGGAVRLGRAIVLELARAGADVVVHCHGSRTAAEGVAREVRELGRKAVVAQGDLAQPADVARVFAEADAQLGPVDILIGSAAIFERKPFEEITPEELHRMLDVNLAGPFLCAQQATRRMRAGGKGDIVFLLDVGGTSAAWAGYTHYCSAKAGLAMLTRTLAVELAPAIRVNGVAPGVILPPANKDDEWANRALARVPMGRTGEADEIARTVRFLVGGPRYVTGQIITVDGGRSAAG
jgi:NAD(P)-dependent dehydrogenase (short-subunit alcohol dehydrogenase family)